MAIPTLLLPLNGSLAGQDRNGAMLATGSGALRYQDGPWPLKPDEEATTNLITDPRFTSLANWGGGFGTRQVDPTITLDGVPAIRWDCTGTGGTAYVNFVPRYALNGATVVTASISVRTRPGIQVSHQIGFIDAAGNGITTAIQRPAITTTANGWTRFSWTTLVPIGAVTASYLFRIEANSYVIGDTVWVAKPQVEPKDHATPYCDGALGGRDSWTGTPNASASVRAASRVNQAAFVEEDTTNWLTNPRLGVDTTNIGTVVGGTLTRISTRPDIAPWVAQLVTPGAANSEGLYWINNQGMGFTGSAFPFIGSVMLAGAGTVDVWVRLLYLDGTLLDGVHTTVVLTTTPVRVVSGLATSDPAKTVDRCELMVRTLGTQAITFYASLAQVEQKAYVTSYTDGSLGAGYAWTGTADASTSTRTVTQVYSGTAPAAFHTDAGSLVFWLKLRNTATVSNGRLMRVGGAIAGQQSPIITRNSGNTLTCAWYMGTTATFLALPALPVDTWVFLSWTWNGPSMSVSYATAGGALTTLTGARTYNTDPIISSAYFGGYSTSQSGNAVVGPYLVFDRALTASEQQALFTSPTPWQWDTLYPKLGGVSRASRPAPVAALRSSRSAPLAALRSRRA